MSSHGTTTSPRNLTGVTDPRRRITAAEAPDVIGVPAGTVRSWASRSLIYACGVDHRHQPLYWLRDLEQLRDRPHPGPRTRVHLTPDDE